MILNKVKQARGNKMIIKLGTPEQKEYNDVEQARAWRKQIQEAYKTNQVVFIDWSNVQNVGIDFMEELVGFLRTDYKLSQRTGYAGLTPQMEFMFTRYGFWHCVKEVDKTFR